MSDTKTAQVSLPPLAHNYTPKPGHAHGWPAMNNKQTLPAIGEASNSNGLDLTGSESGAAHGKDFRPPSQQTFSSSGSRPVSAARLQFESFSRTPSVVDLIPAKGSTLGKKVAIVAAVVLIVGIVVVGAVLAVYLRKGEKIVVQIIHRVLRK